MTSTKKGNAWYFGMKAHVGVDIDSGVVHTLEASTAKVHYSQKFDDLMHGDEHAVFGDKGYVGVERKAAFRAEGKVWGVMRKAPKVAFQFREILRAAHKVKCGDPNMTSAHPRRTEVHRRRDGCLFKACSRQASEHQSLSRYLRQPIAMTAWTR